MKFPKTPAISGTSIRELAGNSEVAESPTSGRDLPASVRMAIVRL